VQPLLQWKSNEYYTFWGSVCSLSYPTCNAHSPYCHLWPVRLYNVLPYYLINGTIFGKTLLNTKCVFWFSLQLLSETFLILRRIKRDVIKKYILVFIYSTGYSCHILMKLEFSRKIFKKHSNINFHEIQSSGRRVAPCGQTDMMRLIATFRIFVSAPIKGRYVFWTRKPNIKLLRIWRGNCSLNLCSLS